MEQKKIASEIKKYPLFQLTNIIALLGIIAAVIIFLLQSKSKELTFSVEGQIALIDFQTIKNDSIIIRYGNTEVTNLFKVNLKIENTGNTAIIKSDLIDSLPIKLESNSRIIDYNLNSSPENILISSKKDSSILTILPDLLNPRDQIIINLFYTSSSEESCTPSFNPRIIDGNSKYLNKLVVKKNHNRFYFQLPLVVEILLIFIGLTTAISMAFIFLFLAFGDKSKKTWKDQIIFSSISISNLILFIYVLIKELL